MPTITYQVVKIQPEWGPNPEDMGTKRKFWYQWPGDEVEWLFKYPRDKTGEHWAEKIAAELAKALQISCATVELAEWGGVRGSASRSFLSAGQELVHGNQILKWTLDEYDSAKKFRHSDHSFENIWRSFERLFVHREDAEMTSFRFAEYLLLDALIGNTDRHHENWAMVWEPLDPPTGDLSPSFDHASSLGRELLDEKRRMRLEGGTVGHYAEKGRGAIYLQENQRRGPSPLGLVRSAVHTDRRYFAPVLARLDRLRDARVHEIVDRVPSEWMSPSAKAFATTLIRYNRDQLLEL